MTNYIGKRKECNIVDDYMDFNSINPCKGKYRFEIPNIGTCCKVILKVRELMVNIGYIILFVNLRIAL